MRSIGFIHLRTITAIWLAIVTWAGAANAQSVQLVDYARDVRPILSQYCFRCHGPDEGSRESGLRLDQREAALKAAESGKHAIVPGKTAASELIRRIESSSDDEIMPPPTSKKSLNVAQKRILKAWVEQGAKYQDHWAFQVPQQQPLPTVRRTEWVRNPIDRFVLARLETAGLTPSAQADAYSLIRRTSLDLVGLPPTLSEVDRFLKDVQTTSLDAAYEQLVDRLLASPQYGERWARRWLDLARYADTNGYEKDRQRSIWPYRDWVIRALNQDMPFDQFTIEQLAGDMLPQATTEQRIATGFHRNTMLNEEGGIDPLEFRFHAMTDRVATTGTTWLGLTVGCAQCHTHKYDPITHHDYYRFMAFLNNADEPEFDVPNPSLEVAHQQNLKRADKLTDELESHWPNDIADWKSPELVQVSAAGTPDPKRLDDGSVLFAAPGPERDEYTFDLLANAPFDRLKLEALIDPSLPMQGPGRTPHGNFVLTEIEVFVQGADPNQPPQKIAIERATASVEQDKYPVANAFDGQPQSGWGVHDPKVPLNTSKVATFVLSRLIEVSGPTKVTVKLHQQLGSHHTLGRVKLSLGKLIDSDQTAKLINERFAQWRAEQRARIAEWQTLTTIKATSNLPLLTPRSDGSIFVSGDTTKYDILDVTLETSLPRITALRLEALPDERLPADGPGLTYYEGTPGDFFLSEFILSVQQQAVPFAQATESFWKNRFGANVASAAQAIDGDPQTGWSVDGRQGERHVAVFRLAEPISAKSLQLKLTFGRHFASTLGRFRLSATSEEKQTSATTLSAEQEALLRLTDEALTPAQWASLKSAFLLEAPELKKFADQIRGLRKKPRSTTTLVMQERPANNPRPTHRHHRGEFLQPRDVVTAQLPSFLPTPKVAPKTRLDFARWLVSAENPLAARVTVNRHWAAFFGSGLVGSLQDFGLQGDFPTHPELLDWLAVNFMTDGWSFKRFHKLIVMSATYRQESHFKAGETTASGLHDRGPRLRLDAELIRDSALQASGLLSSKLGGPSVFPPQPANITTEGTYGAMNWPVSSGEDRYRRSLYTFTKRTAPFAMTVTFDGPSGESCIARRDVSNTPLQALTLLNDAMFHEAAQALGKLLAADSASAEARIEQLFRRCLTRPPTDAERADLLHFYELQVARFKNQELNASAINSDADASAERAAWTTLARVLLNVDEFIVKD